MQGFEPPPAEVGQSVLWSEGRGSEAFPAIVGGVGDGSKTLNLYVFSPKGGVHYRNGVKHEDDPRLAERPGEAITNQPGCWRLVPSDQKQHEALMRAMGRGPAS